MQQENQEIQVVATTQKATTQRTTIPPLPHWPTSKPGPMVTEPPTGTKRVHLRSEQVVEIDYDQERGVPITSRTGE